MSIKISSRFLAVPKICENDYHKEIIDGVIIMASIRLLCGYFLVQAIAIIVSAAKNFINRAKPSW